nr:MAG TPA: tail collar fiber protein [Caudoviricetes sp.]
MAEFSKLVITNKGQALLAKMIAGEGSVEFTKVSASSTAYTDAQLEGLTSLSNVKQTSLISKITRTNGVAIKVEAAFTNTELTAGYYMKALGLYAVDPDDGEILYAVTRETSGNCYMPAYNGITVSGAYVQLVTTVGNAENVSLEVDQAAVATIGDIQDLQKQIADLEAFIGYSDEDIFGVEVDFANKKFTRLSGAVNRTPGAGFDSINAFGGRKRCNVADDGTVTAYYGDSGYTTTGKNAAGTPVQVMVEQPKFYYKVVPMVLEKGVKGMKIRKARYYVSDTLKPGFKVHPAFVENGNVNPYIYLAAFEGSLFDTSANAYILDDSQVADFAADKLSSIAGVKPISGLQQNLTRGNTRLLARKRGAGWEQAYAATAAASQLLMLIEYASFNMQSAIGNGVTNKTDDGASSMTEITGATANLGNASGSVTNANGYNIVSYRGEENFWGNIWTWVDGMNEENPATFTSGMAGTLHVADHGFADDTKASPYKNTGIHPIQGSGYVSAFGYSEEFDWLFIAVEYSGNSSLPVGDYAWNNNPGWRVTLLGGRWSNGAGAGAFCWHLDSASAHRYRDVGGRLVYVPSKKAA